MLPALTMTFVAAFFTALAGLLSLSAARHSPQAELRKRLRRLAVADGEVSLEVSGDLMRETSPLERFLLKLPLMVALRRLVIQSGLRMEPMRFALLIVSGSLGGFIITFMLKKHVGAALLAAGIVVVVMILFLNHLRQKRERKFTEQLPDALTMVARSLRAGHSLTGAIELISEELPEPAGPLFKIVYDQQKLGMRITDAMGMLLDRIESLDLRFFVTIIRINNEIGGNLAEILEKLSDTIRSRLQIRRQVRVYTAQGRLSGYVLALLPVAIFVTLYFLNPGYLDVFFTDHKAQYILAGAAGSEVVGFLVIRRIIDIRI